MKLNCNIDCIIVSWWRTIITKYQHYGITLVIQSITRGVIKIRLHSCSCSHLVPIPCHAVWVLQLPSNVTQPQHIVDLGTDVASKYLSSKRWMATWARRLQLYTWPLDPSFLIKPIISELIDIVVMSLLFHTTHRDIATGNTFTLQEAPQENVVLHVVLCSC